MAATGDQQPAYKLPLIVPLVRDTNTSLYTIKIKNDGPLVVDLAGTLVWSTCPSAATHSTVPCQSGTCGTVNQEQPRRCRYVDGGWFWSGREPGTRCALLQLQLQQRSFGNKFALCLPGFASFGDTPVYIGIQDRGFLNYTDAIPYTPILTNPRSSGYYLPVKAISVWWNAPNVTASLPAGALDLDVRTGRGGVVLSTTTPYAIMRPDVFRAFSQAFDAAIKKQRKYSWTNVRRVPAVEPFNLCYDGGFPFLKRPTTYDVPTIYLELAGATASWPLFTENYMVRTSRGMCVGILEMEPGVGMPVDGEPAMVLGLKQLDMNMLVFDLDKMLLWFSGELSFRLGGCRLPAH
uniref:Xylanase inhibitor C-terminal domain-containing protein n=1 Tax=Oryza brachyantha TaxID=4533 RepID=J3L7P1_ORYBR